MGSKAAARRVAGIVGLGLALAAGTGLPRGSAARAQPASGNAAGVGCGALAGLAVPVGSVGLPVGGVRVVAAIPVEAAGEGALRVGAFCRVSVEIDPVDRAAPPIRAEVNLPENWNGRALMFGGGGYNGSILSTPGSIRLQPKDLATPLGRGYATFGSDSGHAGSSADGSFALNEEALRNYAHEALKKTRDVAGAVIAARYGRAPEKVFFHGSSNGGKEALAMIQRYPADLDGAMIFWPAASFTRLASQHVRIARALLEPGAYPSVAARRALLRAGLGACDGLDGVADGVVADPRRCQARFDPATATVDGRPLLCPDGAAAGDGAAGDCVTAAQLRAVRVMGTPLVPGGTAAVAAPFPGFDAWGLDLGTGTADELGRGVTAQGLGTVPPGEPLAAGMPFIHVFATQFVRHFVTRDARAGVDALDPAEPGRWAGRLRELAELMDMGETDLSAFAARGGKILLLHGTADQIIPVRATEEYYEAVVARMGRDRVAGFLRFYELPGAAHSGNGTAFTPTWDALGALDAWAGGGGPPRGPVITDVYARPGRTRPLCEYPAVPRYAGSGPVDEAGSFACAE